MSSMVDRYPRRDGLYEVLPDAVAVFDRYQNRVVKLDPLASEIWLRIDGMSQVKLIASDIAGQSGQTFEDVLRRTLAITGMLLGEGLIYLSLQPEPLPYHLAMPREDQDPVQTEESMRAAGWTEHGNNSR